MQVCDISGIYRHSLYFFQSSKEKADELREVFLKKYSGKEENKSLDLSIFLKVLLPSFCRFATITFLSTLYT